MIGAILQNAAVPTEAGAAAAGLPGLPASERPVVGTYDAEIVPRTQSQEPKGPRQMPRTAWPEAATGTITIPRGDTAGAGGFAEAKGIPIAVAAAESATPTAGTSTPKSSAVPVKIETRVFAREQTERLGVRGLVFSLQPRTSAGTPAAPSPAPSTVALSVDYADFANSFGGSYASRMRLVELPACALTTPSKDVCRTTKPIATVNDGTKQTLTAKRVELASGEAKVLAAVAAAEGDKGDYKATSLSPSAAWNTDLSTGDFGWSYDMPVPDVPGSLTPNVGLSYSSGTIDGRTGGTNNQSSWAGDGFNMWPGSIERRYKPCADDDQKNADGNKPGDLCWAYDNAFLSFNGKGGELVPVGADEFKLKQDDGTRIARLKSTNRGNGDNDGEYWRLTAPDGVRYYFGYNRLPGWTDGKEATDSTWTVPIYGNDEGEPCKATDFAGSWCQQAWRWNLDYAVDPHGNAIGYHYTKETNSYGRNLKEEDDTTYTRGGYLERIDYGLKSDRMFADKPQAQVIFDNAERCLPQTGVTCAASTIGDKAPYWYDTPWDLNCTAGTKCDNGRLSPSFWTRKRLTDVTTQTLNADGTYSKIDAWKLSHRWGMADTDYQLLLDSVQHTGHSATPAITLPKTTFTYTQLENRLDKTGDGFAPFIKARLSTVADESGGQVDVNYSASACDWNALPTPQTNTTRCFPQYIGGSSTADAERHWFNKYVVTSTTTTDRTGGAPDAVIRYQYLGGAAWHFDDDEGLTKEKHKTWSQWRGYGQVRVQTGGQGGAAAMKSQQDSYFLRGMDGDRKDTADGTKSVTVPLADGEGDPITDHESTAGFSYKTVTYDKPDGKILSKSVSRPWHHETAKRTRSWGTVTANLTGSSSTKEWESLDEGAGAKWRIKSTATKHDTVAGRVIQIDDFGDAASTADDRCTRTTYPSDAVILDAASRVEIVAKPCDATVDRSKDVISDVRTAYDGGAYDAAPTKGDVTASATLKSHDGTKATYLETGTTYDGYGRTLTSTDLTANVTVDADNAPARVARADGRTTTTVYTPATGLPTQVKTTTPPATAGDASTAQTTAQALGLRGLPMTETDTNGNVTESTFDALGRAAKVWLADRRNTLNPSYQFTYVVEEGKPVAVATRTLDNNGGQITSYALYDGFLRERQTQAPGPDGGSILTDIFYDERGLAAKKFAPYYSTGQPSATLFRPADALSVETQTRSTFDGLGREVESRQIAGNGDGGSVLNVTATRYRGDRTTVIPPVGGIASTTVKDAHGQTTALLQHHQRDADAPYDTTTYDYTPRDELRTLTDPSGSTWSYTYDQLGRQIRTVDPDKGTTTNVYDDRGQLTSSTDARGTTLVSAYDNLGRKTALREGTATGALRSAWVYDTVADAKGQLAESTRYVNGQAYTSKVTAYDRLYRPTRTAVVIPEAEGVLQGTYQTGTAFKLSGLVGTVSYSAAGSLPGGSVTYGYEDQTLRQVAVYGEGMTSSVSYSLTGKPLQYGLSPSGGGKKAQVTNTYEWGTQRLATSRVDREEQNGVDRNTTYRYDDTGNVLSMADVSRTGTDNQCFSYDHLRRLTEAWTQPTATCSATPATSKIGGPAPYWQSYTYDKASNRATEIQHNPAGDTSKDVKRTYSYPGSGKALAHSLTSVTSTGPAGTSTDNYGYDKAGNTTSRPGQTLAWDVEGHLSKVTEGARTTEYLYDADGNRLIGRTSTETTLYLGHTEVTLAKGADKAKATRYVDIGGGQGAVRNDDGTVAFTIADHHGTGQLAVSAADLTLTQRRTLPFGAIRGDAPKAWPGTKGFVGGTDDTKATGLTHLGAREYDPGIGRFISVDPLLQSEIPQTLNGYSYGTQNPVTITDPSGLGVPECHTGELTGCHNGVPGKGTKPAKTKSEKKKGTSSSSSSSGGRSNSGGSTWAPAPSPSPGKAPAPGPYLGKRVDGPAIQVFTYVLFFLPDPVAWKDCVNSPGLTADCASTVGDLPTPLKILKLAKGAKHIDGAAGAAKKAPSGCKCFLPGTDVLLADGTTKDIEDIKLGDQVLATDPETGETGPREVTRLIVTKDDKHFNTLSIMTEDGVEELTATHEHPFWSPSERRWLEAGELTAGMTLLSDDGTTVIVTANRAFTKHATTYNLTVAEIHTYYVLAGDTPVLVHNSGECPNGGAPRSADGKFSKRNGEPGRDGAADEANAWDQLEMDGAVVMRNETAVSAPGMRVRKYDGTVEINGQWYGIEVKGGTAKKNPQQRDFDDWLNSPGNTVTTGDGRTLVGVHDVWIDR
ncbi:polymorphic toxin-type HINT domain-containing protein [Streptomyces sp. NPDC059092]|uniref:polymorphic toxin-type HINT domain-containing protein n=1 Tax=Streptomyces sp. NPDC059092 TaxID=3346725 RepID=UPI0036B472DD